MEYRYIAIVINKKDVGEADRIYTLFTREAGKIQARAEGVRKPQAKLAGHLESFVLADISMVRKRGLGKITGSVVEKNFSNLRNNIDALESVFQALDIFNRLIGFEDKDPRVFDLLKDYLETMDSAGAKEKFDLLSQGFIFQLFGLLGYKIQVLACVSCGKKITEQDNYFSIEEGGTTCNLCAPKLKNKVKISNNTIKIIRIFLSNNIKSMMRLKVGEEEIRNLKFISGQFAGWITK